jgi:NAD(P)-dependent dehydrogenase (short-subunit alcohol dehydrogenase family)
MAVSGREGSLGRLAGRVALVTGAASGIGAATAVRFAAEGAAVGLADRDEAGLGRVTKRIADAGGRALPIVVDLAQPGAADRAVTALAEAFGGLDLLVTAAGIIRRHTALETSDAEWDEVVAVNLTAVFRCCRAAIPRLRARGGGAIVTVGSGWSLVGGPRAVSYAATKAAVANLTRALAIDHGPEGIRVNCVCPGDTDTALLRNEFGQLGQAPEAGIAGSAAARPLRRIGTPEEIAAAILYLASDDAAYVTGTTLVIDGGGLAGG